MLGSRTIMRPGCTECPLSPQPTNQEDAQQIGHVDHDSLDARSTATCVPGMGSHTLPLRVGTSLPRSQVLGPKDHFTGKCSSFPEYRRCLLGRDETFQSSKGN